MKFSTINRNILRLALPSIMANITVPLVGIVDLAIAGHLVMPQVSVVSPSVQCCLTCSTGIWDFEVGTEV